MRLADFHSNKNAGAVQSFTADCFGPNPTFDSSFLTSLEVKNVLPLTCQALGYKFCYWPRIAITHMQGSQCRKIGSRTLAGRRPTLAK